MYQEPRQKSKTEIFAKTAKNLQSLFVFAENSIPEVWTGYEYVSWNSTWEILYMQVKTKESQKS